MSQLTTIRCNQESKDEINRLRELHGGINQESAVEALIAWFKQATPEQQRDAIVNRKAIIDGTHATTTT